MELDDLKKPWKDSTDTIPLNNNILELIHHKSRGPLTILKKRFRRGLLLVPVAVAFLITNLSRHHAIFSDVLFWYFIAFCLMMCGYFFFSYRLIHHLQGMGGKVKANLEKQVAALEKVYKMRLIVVRILPVVFVILLEALLYYQQEPSLIKWYAQPLSTRLLSYAGALVTFFFISKYVLTYKYGKHINYLKELVRQMQ